jgi:hypothetical protein
MHGLDTIKLQNLVAAEDEREQDRKREAKAAYLRARNLGANAVQASNLAGTHKSDI